MSSFIIQHQSVSRVSQSALGESVMLDTAGIQGWGELQWGIIMDMSNFSMKDINPFGSKNIAAEHRKLTDEEQLSISNVVYEKVMFELNFRKKSIA